jgi:hypothetical protein
LTAFILGEMTNMTHISNIHLDSANIRQNHRIYWLLHRRIYWLAHRRICWLIGTLTAFTLGEMTYMTHSLNNHLDSIDIWQKSLNLLIGTSSIGWHIDRLYTQWNNKYDPQLEQAFRFYQYSTKNIEFVDWHIAKFVDWLAHWPLLHSVKWQIWPTCQTSI